MTPKEIINLAHAVAAAYRRRCRWADWDDMVQTATEAIIVSQQYFDPRAGLPEQAYRRRAAVLATKRMLWLESAPVSGRVAVLRGLYRAPLSDDLPAVSDVEAEAARTEWHKHVRDRLRAIVKSDPTLVVGLRYLLEPRSSRRGCASYSPAYHAVTKLRRRVANDPALLSLWLDS